jgi:GxxExxY protein
MTTLDEDLESRLPHYQLTQVIIGAMYAVHSELGYGFLEYVYRNAVAVLLRRAGHRVDREVVFEIWFHGHLIGRHRADLVVDQTVVVEVKTARAIDPAHRAQLINYLKASPFELGLLLNFGPSAQFKRIVSTKVREARDALQVPRRPSKETAPRSDLGAACSVDRHAHFKSCFDRGSERTRLPVAA